MNLADSQLLVDAMLSEVKKTVAKKTGEMCVVWYCFNKARDHAINRNRKHCHVHYCGQHSKYFKKNLLKRYYYWSKKCKV